MIPRDAPAPSRDGAAAVPHSEVRDILPDMTPAAPHAASREEAPRTRSGAVPGGAPGELGRASPPRALFALAARVFLLYPLATKALLVVLPALLSFALASRGNNAPLLTEVIPQLLASLDEILTSALLAASIAVLGVGIFRAGARAVWQTLLLGFLSIPILRLTLLALTGLLVRARLIDGATPGQFADALPATLVNTLLLAGVDLLLLAAFTLLFVIAARRHRSPGKVTPPRGKKAQPSPTPAARREDCTVREDTLADKAQDPRATGAPPAAAGKPTRHARRSPTRSPLLARGSGYRGVALGAAWTVIARKALSSAREVVGALAVGSDGWSLADIARGYGVWSKETLLLLLSGGVFPLALLAATAAATLAFTRQFASRADSLFSRGE